MEVLVRMLRSRQLAATAHNVPLAVAQSRHFAPDRLTDAGFVDALVRSSRSNEGPTVLWLSIAWLATCIRTSKSRARILQELNPCIVCESTRTANGCAHSCCYIETCLTHVSATRSSSSLLLPSLRELLLNHGITARRCCVINVCRVGR